MLLVVFERTTLDGFQKWQKKQMKNFFVKVEYCSLQSLKRSFQHTELC